MTVPKGWYRDRAAFVQTDDIVSLVELPAASQSVQHFQTFFPESAPLLTTLRVISGVYKM